MKGGMYHTTELIPTKFLILVAHFIICILLLWNAPQSAKVCLPEGVSAEASQVHHTQLVVGLSVAVGMICFELLLFVIGLTMFNTTSALLYFCMVYNLCTFIINPFTISTYKSPAIACHCTACVLLTYAIFDSWHCGWFWWIFSVGSVLPAINDVCILVDVLINKKY